MRPTLWALPLVALACSGQIIEPPGITPGPGQPGPTGGAVAPLCTQTAPPAQRLYLMDMQSYTNSITDLLGTAAVTDMTRQVSQRVDLFTNGVPTLTDAVQRETVAEYASKTLTGAALTAFTGCAGVAAQTDDCARKALAGFMTKAFRRPVEAAEVDSLMTTAYATGKMTSFERGVQLGVEAILQAGSTMYFKEIGAPNGKGLMALDPYEVATQLSYAMLDSIPDDALSAAAAGGRLKTSADIEGQVARLLTMPRAQQKLNELLLRQYHLDDVLAVSAIDASYQSILTPAMLGAMYQETSLLMQDVLWTNPRSYLELFTTNKTFVNADLATKIYNIPYTGTGGQFVPVELPADHTAGLLTKGSLLAGKAKANTGSVVKRGKSLRINFLCLGSPPPPPTADPNVKAKLEAQQASAASESELASQRAMDPVCKTCHASFDPLGLALNQFDRAGRYVATAEAVSAPLVGVDSTVWDTASVSGPVDLGMKVTAHPNLAACVASSVLRYETHDPNEVTDCSVENATKKFTTAGFRFDALVKAVSTSDVFLYRSPGN